MSVEEDIELRDLVAQTLETNGCLAKIRAQLRASIFLALDEDVKLSRQEPLMNNKVKAHLETEDGKLMFCVVREFLEFFNLYFTLSVFDSESYMGNGYKYESRDKLAEQLGLDNAECPAIPLLLQLIKIAQAKTKSLEINLSLHKKERDENISITEDYSSNLHKTDSNISINETNIKADNNKTLATPVPEKLNVTFDLTSPTVNLNFVNKSENNVKQRTALLDDSKDQILDGSYKKEEKDDDTYGDTSSIAEDSVALVNIDNVTIPDLTLNGIEETTLTKDYVVEVSQHSTQDKSKVSPQKSEKLKTKSSLNTLSDLPPLQMNKSRVNDILPSLYTKEFKDKSNLRELDKLFDMEVEYEEDFICSGDDFSLKSEHSKSNVLDDLQVSTKCTSSDPFRGKRDSKQKIYNQTIFDSNKQPLKLFANTSKSTDNLNVDTNKTEGSSSSSINESLDINSSNI